MRLEVSSGKARRSTEQRKEARGPQHKQRRRGCREKEVEARVADGWVEGDVGAGVGDRARASIGAGVGKVMEWGSAQRSRRSCGDSSQGG